MREIKFRAYALAEKLMCHDVHEGVEDEDLSFADYLNNETYVLMQYTGLKDKNGEEIYEGDIVKKEHSPMTIGGKDVVKYGESSGSSRMPVFGWYTDKGLCLSEKSEIEVIGNIYENPGLLK